MSFSRGSSVSWAVEVAATSRRLRIVEYMVGVTGVTLSRVVTCSHYVTCPTVYQVAGVCMAVWSRHGPGTDWSAEMGTGALYPGH